MRFFVLMLMPFAALAAPHFKTNEHTCLALNIYHEARSEPTTGQLAVGMVTINRLNSAKYPNTICGVVWQRKQFSWTKDGKHDRPSESKAWNEAQRLASYLIHRYRNRASVADVTNGAVYYYAHHITTPYWADKINVTTIIGDHTFGK